MIDSTIVRKMMLLRLLCGGEYRFSEIKEILTSSYNDMTLSRYLKELELEGYIIHNNSHKTYITSSSGEECLKNLCKQHEENYIAIMTFIFDKDYDLVDLNEKNI